MAIMAIFNCQGFTRDIYEKLRNEVRWEQDVPAGQILHAASFDASGNLRVVDIWESENSMKSFFESRLGPAVEKYRVQIPAGEIFPIHNINAFSGISNFIMEKNIPLSKTA